MCCKADARKDWCRQLLPFQRLRGRRLSQCVFLGVVLERDVPPDTLHSWLRRPCSHPSMHMASVAPTHLADPEGAGWKQLGQLLVLAPDLLQLLLCHGRTRRCLVI